MNKSSGKVTFVAAAVFIFLTTMYFVSGGVLNMTTLTSIPIILSAEGIVFVLLYATTYHSEAEGTSEHH